MSQCDDTIAAILEQVSGSWSCQPVDSEWLHVTTSYQYSDGDLVELLIKVDDDHVVVTDGGETAARLDLAGVNLDTGRAHDLWRRLIRANQLELTDGRLCQEGALQEVGLLADNMANALANLDSIRLVALPPPKPGFAQMLVTFLQAEFEYVEEQPQLRGRSGVSYRSTASAGRTEEPVFVQAVAGSRPQTRQRAVEHAFTMFSDVNGNLPTERKLVVLGGAGNWRAEHIDLLATVAYVGEWENRGGVVNYINGPQLKQRSRIILGSFQSVLPEAP